MIYIVCALLAEARPLIEHFSLRHNVTSPFPLYENSDIQLTLSGIGKIKSAIATTKLLQHAKKSDVVLNIGLCAHNKNISIGTPILIHQVIDVASKRSYYPEIYQNHFFKESTLSTFDTLVTTLHTNTVDMEASGFFEAASDFLQNDRIVLFKIVSDHFEKTMFSKEQITELIKHVLPDIITYIETLHNYKPTLPDLIDPEEEQILDTLKQNYRLSATQGHQLKNTYVEAKIGLNKRTFNFEPYLNNVSIHKQERSKLFNQLLTELKSIS